MAKKLRDEDLQLNIIVNGDKGKKELGDLEKSTRELTNRNKELRAEKQKLIRAGKQESEEYKAVTREIRENNRTIKANEARMTELRKEIGLTGLTMRQLRSEQTRLKRLMDSTTPGTPQWKKYRAELNLVEEQMKKVRAGGQMMKLSIGSIADGFNRFAAMGATMVATLTGIAFSVSNLIKGMVDLDDQLADVMKTTGLTQTQVRALYQDFKTFNTRTPRKELLLLAEEAGRLGFTAREDIKDFVDVANQIKVALGDDLGGESDVAIREVGKLTEIYKVGVQYGTGFRDSMLKVGSAINEVSANSNAQAPFLIDYLKRMGGIAGQTKVTSAEILGYASALDQLGQKQEMAATAHGKIMVDMFNDHAKYASIARMSSKDFYDLLQTDANEAFIKLLEGLNSNNAGFSTMAAKLDELGVDGARAVQVLSVLSANTEMVRKQQELANKAMDEGVSLTNEYNIKNNNLAASYQKIGQYLHAQFINSTFLGWLEKVVGKVSEWTEIPLSSTLREEQTELNLLVSSITNANNTQETRNTLIGELQEAYPDFLKNLDSEKVTNEELRDRLSEVNQQYETRILLAIKEEALQANYKKRVDLKLEELEAIKQIAKYEGIAAQAREKIGSETDANKLRSLLTDQEIAALNAMDLLPKKLESIRSQFSDLIVEETELNNAVNELRTSLGTDGLGGTDTTTGTRKTVGNKVYEWDGNTWQLVQDIGTDSGGSPSTSVEDIVIDSQDKMLYETDQLMYQEMLDAKKAGEEEFTAWFKQQVEKREDALAQELQIEKEIEQARQDLKDIRINAIGDIAGALANMFEQGSAGYIAFFALEKAMGLAQVWVSYAKEAAAINATAAAMGPLGIPYAATMNAKALVAAKVNTGIIVAQAIASVAKGLKGKGKKEGGFAGFGGDDEVDGFYHKNEWIASAPVVRHPVARKFIDVFQYAQETGNIHRLNMETILGAVAGGMGGKKEGGFAQPGNTFPNNNLPAPQVPTDPELKELIRQNLRANRELKDAAEKLHREGTYTRLLGRNGLIETQKDYDRMRREVSL